MKSFIKKTINHVKKRKRNKTLFISSILGLLILTIQFANTSYGQINPVIWIVSESILNSDELQTKVRNINPETHIFRSSYGGSQSIIGLAGAATRVIAPVSSGNLLPDSRLTLWDYHDGVLVTEAQSPKTGKFVYKLTSGTAKGSRVTLDFAVPDSVADFVTLSAIVEPDEKNFTQFRLAIYNVDRKGVVQQFDWSKEKIANDLALLPMRYMLTASVMDGVGFSAGEKLRAYIYVGQGDNPSTGKVIYVSEVQVNAGVLPATYHETTGTPDEPGNEMMQLLPGGFYTPAVGMAVIQFGRNDAGSGMNASDHQAILEAIISGLASKVSHVMLAGPPPNANQALTAFEDDRFELNGLLEAEKNAAKTFGIYYYDAYNDFKDKVNNQNFKVSELMRDYLHATTSTEDGKGIDQYAQEIMQHYQSLDTLVTPQNQTPNMSLFGEQLTGDWNWTLFNIGNGPFHNIDVIHAGYRHGNKTYVKASNTPNDELEFRVTGSLIGVIMLNDEKAVGTADVYVDGVLYKTIVDQAGLSFYPKGHFVASGLENKEHVVKIKVVEGEVRPVAVVAF